jgi:hypothetical protein
MTSHEEWFRHTRDFKTLMFVEINDDTTHPITQIGKVPLSMQDEETKYLKDVLLCSNHNKKFSFSRPNGGIRFIVDIQP